MNGDRRIVLWMDGDGDIYVCFDIYIYIICRKYTEICVDFELCIHIYVYILWFSNLEPPTDTIRQHRSFNRRLGSGEPQGRGEVWFHRRFEPSWVQWQGHTAVDQGIHFSLAVWNAGHPTISIDPCSDLLSSVQNRSDCVWEREQFHCHSIHDLHWLSTIYNIYIYTYIYM